jgi:diguanylate cyclase (GGDEF)-like protein/PAS domain S-box-containing protein
MSSRHRHKLTLRLLWTVGGLSLLVLAALVYLSSGIDDHGRSRVDLTTNELIALDLAINLEVLKLRQGQRLDYDNLVATGNEIDRRLASLENEFAALGLKSELTPAGRSWADKQLQVERFKRIHSVFSTSQHHFVNLAETLSREQQSPRLNQASQQLMAFLMKGGNEALPPLVSGLAELDQEIAGWAADRQVPGKLLVKHASFILANVRELQAITQAVANSPLADDIHAAQYRYAEAHALAMRDAGYYRWGLAIFALLLGTSVIFVLTRLRATLDQLRSSHEVLDNIADNLGEGIVAFDAGGQLRFINRRAEVMIGRRADDLVGHSMDDVLFAGGPAEAVPPLAASVAAGQRYSGEGWLNGQARVPVGFLGAPLPAGHSEVAGGYVLSLRDLSETRAAEARLHLAAHVFDSLAEAMVITDDGGRIQSVNPAFSTITGFTESEAIGRKPGELLQSGQHDSGFYGGMWQELRERGAWQGEVTNRRKNGETYTEWLSISAVRDGDGRTIQYVGLFSDISERKEAEAFIYHLAYHDPLTGLANRVLFRDRLDTALRQSQRSNRVLAVMIFDLDRFKIINDTLGHLSGDQLLKQVALRLQGNIREYDTLARLGGDEFALLLPEMNSAEDALHIARKLLGAMKPAFTIGERELFASTSIGVAVFPKHGRNGEELLRNADVALYAAKHAGRNTLSVFDPRANEANDDLEIESGLRYAIARDELVLHYQPQFDIRSGAISGAEALVRWQNPSLGLVSPGRFIPLAEQTDLIEEIGEWCLNEACRQFVRWKAGGVPIPRVSVNVSARQLRGHGFADRVIETVRRHAIEPHRLELELTESLLTDDATNTIAIFNRLRRHGIRIAIDDFGTGYSSLKYLADFPIDVLKIDQSFVARLHENSDSLYVVQAMIMLAAGMAVETVAEGVETEEQRARLLALGANHLQGFLLARPQAADAIAALAMRHGAMQESSAPPRHSPQ